MNEGTAIDFAQKRMKEMGVDTYMIRYRHLQIAPLATISLDGQNHLYYLIQPNQYIRVKSKAGIFDVQDNAVNEMQHVHRGKMTIKNLYQNRYLQVMFIQVIPSNKTQSNGEE